MQLCVVCGKSYTSRRGRQYCSNVCRNQKWKLTRRENYLAAGARYRERIKAATPERISEFRNCIVCGLEFEVSKYHPEQISQTIG